MAPVAVVSFDRGESGACDQVSKAWLCGCKGHSDMSRAMVICHSAAARRLFGSGRSRNGIAQSGRDRRTTNATVVGRIAGLHLGAEPLWVVVAITVRSNHWTIAGQNTSVTEQRRFLHRLLSGPSQLNDAKVATLWCLACLEPKNGSDCVDRAKEVNPMKTASWRPPSIDRVQFQDQRRHKLTSSCWSACLQKGERHARINCWCHEPWAS
jgi:hypothetical protein